CLILPPPTSTLFPYTTLFRSEVPSRVVRCEGSRAGPLPFALAISFEGQARFVSNGNGARRDPGRRQSSRRSLAMPIRVRPENVPWFEEAMSLDLSPRGMRFRSQREYATGDLLRIALEDGSSTSWPGSGEFRAKVVSVSPAADGVALDVLGLPVLRFNFRGAGLSAGKHDRGAGEQGDLRAALDFLAKQIAGVPLLLAGFSFGAWVGLRVGCEEPRVSHLIGLGIPVNSSDFSFLRNCKRPKLFVHGSADQYGAVEKVKRLVPSWSGENHLTVVEGADHFFAGELDQLHAAITNWLREVFRLRH